MTQLSEQLQARRALADGDRHTREIDHENLLLRACLLPDARAVEAWEGWRERARRVNDLPTHQHRLVPLLHANLSALGVEHPELARYAGVRRFYFLHQQALWRVMRPVVAALHDAGVRLMLLKSYPILRAYASPELRPSSDLDVWVHDHDLPRAFSIIQDLGFPTASRRLHHPRELARACAAQHAVTFRRKNDRIEIDVHGRLHKALPSLAMMRDLHAQAPTIPFADRPIPVLPSHASLLHAAVYAHGARERLVLRGVVDVAMLIRSPATPIDWPALVRLAHSANALTPLARIVHLAYPLLGREVPAEVEGVLRSLPASRSDTRYWSLARRQGPLAQQRLMLLHYLRAREVAARDGAPRPDPLGYLRDLHHVRSRLATLGLMLRYPFKRRREPTRNG